MDKATELTIDYNVLYSHFKAPLNTNFQYKTQPKYLELYFNCLNFSVKCEHSLLSQ
jgi:hypothetical protein